METCKHGSGAGSRKPTAEMRQGAECRAYQFSHNLTLTYSMCRGRYNVSLECRNFTNEKLYDNFSLQKAGRAFYGKVRIYLGR